MLSGTSPLKIHFCERSQHTYTQTGVPDLQAVSLILSRFTRAAPQLRVLEFCYTGVPSYEDEDSDYSPILSDLSSLDTLFTHEALISLDAISTNLTSLTCCFDYDREVQGSEITTLLQKLPNLQVLELFCLCFALRTPIGGIASLYVNLPRLEKLLLEFSYDVSFVRLLSLLRCPSSTKTHINLLQNVPHHWPPALIEGTFHDMLAASTSAKIAVNPWTFDIYAGADFNLRISGKIDKCSSTLSYILCRLPFQTFNP